jgi:hypothetical protein
LFYQKLGQSIVELLEHRINIKLVVKLKNSATDIYNMLQEVYRGETKGGIWISMWVKQFQDSEDITDNERSCYLAALATDLNVIK